VNALDSVVDKNPSAKNSRHSPSVNLLPGKNLQEKLHIETEDKINGNRYL